LQFGSAKFNGDSMNPQRYQSMRQCLVDFPLEITPSEIGTLAKPVNVLFKAAHLIGPLREFDSIFETIFDIAEEIAGVEYCAYMPENQISNGFTGISGRHVLPPKDEPSVFLTPAAMAIHFGKAIHIDSKKDPSMLPVCESWQATSLVAFPLRIEHEPVGALVFGKKKTHPFTTVQIKLLFALAIQAENILLQHESMKALSFYSFLDPLTHLHNRRFFDNQLEKEILRSRRSGKPFALLMIDIDGFKTYNDTFLHSSGDVALQEFATILQSSVREVDTVARLGGDEFTVILVESDAFGAQDLAQRIIKKFGNHLLPGVDHNRTEKLSVSIGISTFPGDSFDLADLMEKADRALFLAKNEGGKRVSLFQDVSDILSVQPPSGELPLQKIYRAAQSVVDIDKFLEILLFTAMKGLEAERGSIIVIDPVSGNYCLRAAIGFHNGKEQLLPGATVSPGSVTSWVLEHNAPLVVSRVEEIPFPLQRKKNGYSTDSFLSIPLTVEDQLLGALHLTNRRSARPFTRKDLDAFQPIAGEIAWILSRGMEFQENVKRFSTSILHSLSSALELRFPFLTGHSKRVRDLCLRVGKRMGLGPEELGDLGTAASLHDIGNVGIPGAILLKNRTLTDREMEVARKHPFLAYKLMEGIPGMQDARRIVLEHHEFADGSGYPYGLRGEEMSRGAKILCLSEFYDSITSERPHRGRLHHEEAIQLMKNSRKILFDDVTCAAFFEELQTPDNTLITDR
jgi:diguanylate cyclase (GGDEF)-like protein